MESRGSGGTLRPRARSLPPEPPPCCPALPLTAVCAVHLHTRKPHVQRGAGGLAVGHEGRGGARCTGRGASRTPGPPRLPSRPTSKSPQQVARYRTGTAQQRRESHLPPARAAWGSRPSEDGPRSRKGCRRLHEKARGRGLGVAGAAAAAGRPVPSQPQQDAGPRTLPSLRLNTCGPQRWERAGSAACWAQALCVARAAMFDPQCRRAQPSSSAHLGAIGDGDG